MPLDSYLTLGHSGLRVSPMCLGTMTFGEDWGWGASEQDCQRMLDRYFSLGGNFVDTANLYTLGHAEKIIGDHLANDKAQRQRTVLATKFFASMSPGDPNAGGAGRKNIMAACEASLRRLRTDYIDMYWMHCWDFHTPIEETMRALDDLVRSGKVRHIGFSDTPAWKVTQAQMMARQLGWAPLIGLQVEYSLLERTVEGELVPMARELGLGITPWSPLKSGILTGKYRRDTAVQADRGSWVTSALSETTHRVVDVLLEVANEAETTPARAALAWLMAQPGVTSVIFGARTMAQMEDNLAAMEITLAPHHLTKLSTASKPSLNFPAEFVANSGPFRSSGATVNGEKTARNSLSAKPGQSYY